MIVMVQTDLLFDEFDPFDPLLHVSRRDIRLRHYECGGGEVVVSPRPYSRSLFGVWRPNERATRHGATLVCRRCKASTETYAVGKLARSLRLFLVGPDPETAPAQSIGAEDRFAPMDWPPRRRRRRTDRRKGRDRTKADRSMEGRRRIDEDRRKDPSDMDVPPDEDGP